MFPGAGASVYYNEAGEPLGWDYPSAYEPDYDPMDIGGDDYDDYDDDDPCDGRHAPAFDPEQYAPGSTVQPQNYCTRCGITLGDAS